MRQTYLLFGLLIAVTLVFLLLIRTKSNKSEALCRDCNVILITMTALRYDHMSSNGYFRPTTPNLDNLAKDSLVFDNAFAHASWTLPAAISIYTSLYPSQHGVMNRHDGSTLSKNTLTLVDVLKKAGYITAAFTKKFDYSVEYNFINRFDEYPKPKRNLDLHPATLISFRNKERITSDGFEQTIPKALEWLKNNNSKKFFLHVQGFDAHCPFVHKNGLLYDKDYQGKIDFSYCIENLNKTEPKIIEGKKYWPLISVKGNITEVLLAQEDIDHLIALYDEAITNADKLIGNLLEYVNVSGLLEKTIIIFTSEHGELFGENDQFMRAGSMIDTFYDPVLHIPLIIKHPKLQSKRIGGLVAHIDLTPTLLSFLGITSGFEIEGKDLTPLILNNSQVNTEVFAGAIFTSYSFNPNSEKTQVAVVRDMNWKMIAKTIFKHGRAETRIELYDILNDKKELKNLADTRADISNNLKGKLKKWLKRTGAYAFK